MTKQAPIPNDLKPWIEAKQRFRLSQRHVQMARELGMNPRRLGGLDNHRQEAWKLPLRQFIEHLYSRRFGRSAPDVVRSIEEIALARLAKKQGRRARKLRHHAVEVSQIEAVALREDLAEMPQADALRLQRDETPS